MKKLVVMTMALLTIALVAAVKWSDQVRQFYVWSFYAEDDLVDRQTAWLLILAVLTLVFGLVAVAVGYISFSTAIKQFKDDRKTLMISYLPYLRVTAAELGRDEWAVRVVNSGGAARHCVLVIQVGAKVLFIQDYDVPSQTVMSPVVIQPHPTATCANVIPVGVSKYVWGSAQDARLRWWSISNRGDPTNPRTTRKVKTEEVLRDEANSKLTECGIGGLIADDSWF